MISNLFKPIKDPAKFFDSDESANFMPCKELLKRLEKMLDDASDYSPDDVIELLFFVRYSDDGVVITLPNKGSIAPSDIADYVRTAEPGYKVLENEITVQEYINILNTAIKDLKRARSKSVRFKFHNLVKYGVILGIPDYGYTNVGDIKSFIV